VRIGNEVLFTSSLFFQVSQADLIIIEDNVTVSNLTCVPCVDEAWHNHSQNYRIRICRGAAIGLQSVIGPKDIRALVGLNHGLDDLVIGEYAQIGTRTGITRDVAPSNIVFGGQMFPRKNAQDVDPIPDDQIPSRCFGFWHLIARRLPMVVSLHAALIPPYHACLQMFFCNPRLPLSVRQPTASVLGVIIT